MNSELPNVPGRLPIETANPSRTSKPWIAHLFGAILYAAIITAIFHPWLKPFHLPQRGGPELPFRAGDLTPLFSVWTQVAAGSLFERHEWPLWSDHIYCGEPFFAKPQIGVISLTTLLCTVLPAPVVATWTFLLHLWIAALGMYLWCYEILRRCPLNENPSLVRDHDNATIACLAAASGGATFLLSAFMIEQTMIGHGPIVLVACWTPLILWFLSGALARSLLVRGSLAAGVLVAVQLLAGGETMFLYNSLAASIISLAWIAAGRSVISPQVPEQTTSLWNRLRRVILAGGIIGIVGFGLSAVKVLPGLKLMPVTNRAGGLLLQDAVGTIVEFREPAVLELLRGGVGELADIRHLFPITLVTATLGIITSIGNRWRRWYGIAAILLIAAGVAIAHSKTFFTLLWYVVPMFHYQRIPQRALVLAYLGLSVAVAFGTHRLLAARPARAAPRIAGVVVLAMIVVESWLALPALPPTADIREEIRSNHILNHIAEQPGAFRIHAVESTDRNWGIEHVTVPLGLSNLSGWDHLWLLEYLGAEGAKGRDIRPFLPASYEASHPARFWGMMNVRFVTSTRPISVPGFRFIKAFPVSSRCQPAKSAGPYLYENEEWMPRAWIVPYAILVLGDPAERLQATYRLMDHPQFDPRRVVIVHPETGLAEIDAPNLAEYQAIAVPDSWPTSDALRAGPIGRPLLLYSARSEMFWRRPAEVGDLLNRLRDTSPGESGQAANPVDHIEVAIARTGESRLMANLHGNSGFLVLPEKFAHFPGWQAKDAARSYTLLEVNAVATAVRFDARAEPVTMEITYAAAGLRAGLLITLCSLVIVLVVYVGTNMGVSTRFFGRLATLRSGTPANTKQHIHESEQGD